MNSKEGKNQYPARGMSIRESGGKLRLKLALDVQSRAVFGGTRHEYRYLLHRTWTRPGRAVMFLMMNPSTADIDIDDPTVAKCQRYARRWGFGSLFVANTFAYRATDQKRLLEVADPVGPENDHHILAMAEASQLIVLAYGKPHPRLLQRGLAVQAMLRHRNHDLHVLKLCKDGTPSHPLYLKDDLVPVRL